MGRLIISTAMTVDAVIEPVDTWFVADGDHDRAAFRVFDEAAAMLMGRTTYEGLAGYWPSQEGRWAERINPMPKYVVSRNPQGSLEWNAAFLEEDVADAVRGLKAELDGDLFAVGLGELARFLLEQDLVDELLFWVHPSVWGEGKRPFHGEQKVRLQLVGTETFDSGVTLLRYAPARES